VRVFDDYAHHPTEVAATLEPARALVDPPGRCRERVISVLTASIEIPTQEPDGSAAEDVDRGIERDTRQAVGARSRKALRPRRKWR
jgi:hypothetical protein